MKLIKTYSLQAETAQRIATLAGATRRKLSAIVDLAVEQYALIRCPICASPTHPDPDRPGVRFCDTCRQPVIFERPQLS
jgi:hypothetical protein